MKVYQAHGKAGKYAAATPKEAAIGYFERFPASRKCSVTECKQDGTFFVVEYGPEHWPQSFKDVTKKTVGSLPE